MSLLNQGGLSGELTYSRGVKWYLLKKTRFSRKNNQQKHTSYSSFSIIYDTLTYFLLLTFTSPRRAKLTIVHYKHLTSYKALGAGSVLQLIWMYDRVKMKKLQYAMIEKKLARPWFFFFIIILTKNKVPFLPFRFVCEAQTD